MREEHSCSRKPSKNNIWYSNGAESRRQSTIDDVESATRREAMKGESELTKLHSMYSRP